MGKMNIVLVGITILAFVAAGAYLNLGYSGNAAMSTHYMADGEWTEEICSGCHFNVYEGVQHSYHVDTDISRWTAFENFDVEVEGKDAWAEECGQCHPGGGPLLEYGVAIDCMVCHEQNGLYDFEARSEMIKAGNFENANFAAYAEAKVAAQQHLFFVSTYVLDVLTPSPLLLVVHDTVNGAPNDDSCAKTCHLEDVPKRAVMWGSDDYAEYEVHAEVHCAECHETSHHQIGRGNITDTPNTPDNSYDDTMRSCDDGHCHQGISHGPIVDAHLEKVTCEACHIPMLPGGELVGGAPLNAFSWENGIREDSIRTSDFKPTLAWTNGASGYELPNVDGRNDSDVKLTPFNVITGTWWDVGTDADVVADPSGSISIGKAISPSYVKAADANRDGTVTTEEIQSFDGNGDSLPDYPDAVLRNVDLYYQVSHNIVSTEVGMAKPLKCDDCHGSTSDFDWTLIGYDSDPAETDPPTNFTEKVIIVKVPGAKPIEVEREPAF